jgi:Na+-driven multidrug efflux pump
VRFVLHPILIVVVGVVTLLAGGTLAHSFSKDLPTIQTAAGFLLVAGFACVGVATYHIGGVPLR